MPWSFYVSYFFGGTFLVNSIPHFVSGLMGRAFQTPFAKPPIVFLDWRFLRNRSPFSPEIDHHSPVVDQRDRSEATVAF
jgi:hypothetical protein